MLDVLKANKNKPKWREQHRSDVFIVNLKNTRHQVCLFSSFENVIAYLYYTAF